MSGIVIYGIFATLVALVLLVLLLRIVFKEKEEEEDRVIALNFLTNHSNGRAIGIERELIPGAGERKIAILEPRDLNPKRKKEEEIKNEKVIIDKDKILYCPKGSWSKDRNINIYIPPSASDFPISLKKTELGQALMFYTEVKNAVNTEINAIKEGSKRKSEILERLGDGEISVEFLEKNQELVKDLFKNIVDMKLKEKQYPISSNKSN